jgi:hypothetical protein
MIADPFPSMLGFQIEESSTPISCMAEWSDGCGNVMVQSGNFDHIENQTIIHLEKGEVMGHARS